MSKKKSKFYLKVHKKLGRRVISICDEDLMNKKFESGELNLEIDERFYKGELVEEDAVLNYLKNAKNLNLVGKNIIDLCLKNEIIKPKDIIKVKNIPIAYIIML